MHFFIICVLSNILYKYGYIIRLCNESCLCTMLRHTKMVILASPIVQAALRMKVRLSWQADGAAVQDQCEVNNFPPALWQY